MLRTGHCKLLANFLQSEDFLKIATYSVCKGCTIEVLYAQKTKLLQQMPNMSLTHFCVCYLRDIYAEQSPIKQTVAKIYLFQQIAKEN